MREDLIRGDQFGDNQPVTLSDVSNRFDSGSGLDFSQHPNLDFPGGGDIFDERGPYWRNSGATPIPGYTPTVGTQPLPRTNTDPYAGLPTIDPTKPIQPQLNAIDPTSPWPANSPYRNPAPPGLETSPYYTHATTPSATRPTTATDQASLIAYIQSWAAQNPTANPSVARDPSYWAGAIARTHGAAPIDWNYWEGRFRQPEGAPEGAGGAQGYQSQGSQGSQAYQAPGGTYSATNPFDDPATKNYIDLLNSRIQSLLQPYNNPDAGPLQDWMRKYFAQLQGPTYTPAQQATIQTQALDPIEQQRQAEIKNVAYTMAARGITPGSGPYLQAERDINLKYDQIRAQIQGGLSVNEINLGRQNQAQAANVGGQLAQFTQGLFGTQEARANQAVGLAQEIPNLAQQRIAQAVNLLQGSNVNPAQLLQSLQGFQGQGLFQNREDAAFWTTLFANIAKQFGLG